MDRSTVCSRQQSYDTNKKGANIRAFFMVQSPAIGPTVQGAG